jgi:hypothetical protein
MQQYALLTCLDVCSVYQAAAGGVGTGADVNKRGGRVCKVQAKKVAAHQCAHAERREACLLSLLSAHIGQGHSFLWTL